MKLRSPQEPYIIGNGDSAASGFSSDYLQYLKRPRRRNLDGPPLELHLHLLDSPCASTRKTPVLDEEPEPPTFFICAHCETEVPLDIDEIQGTRRYHEACRLPARKARIAKQRAEAKEQKETECGDDTNADPAVAIAA